MNQAAHRRPRRLKPNRRGFPAWAPSCAHQASQQKPRAVLHRQSAPEGNRQRSTPRGYRLGPGLAPLRPRPRTQVRPTVLPAVSIHSPGFVYPCQGHCLGLDQEMRRLALCVQPWGQGPMAPEGRRLPPPPAAARTALARPGAPALPLPRPLLVVRSGGQRSTGRTYQAREELATLLRRRRELAIASAGLPE